MKGVEERLEKIDSRLEKISETLVRNTSSLEEHMRRTALLEKEVAPITKHVAQLQGAGKLLAYISILAGIIFTIVRLLGLKAFLGAV
jgi:tetrahydromethanopterin S-methyltransferase subunit G